MKALITGGAGSIGSEIARQLIARGDEVTVIDNLSSGSLDNLEDVPEAHVYEADILHDALLLKGLVAESEVVFHMAASLGVKNVIDNPIETMHNNLEATRLVLEAASRRFRPTLIASTSEVYGLSNLLPFKESDPITLGPSSTMRWQYATSKYADEFMALAYRQERGLPVIVTRFFNCVGPHQNSAYGFVLGNFIRQALANEPITVHGDGTQSRCFGDVRDTAYATIRLMDMESYGEVVNVGSTNEITILELARLVRERTHSSSPIVFVPYSEAYGKGYQDMPRRVPSLEKLQALTGFTPSTPLVETIDRTAKFLSQSVAVTK